VAEKRIRTRFEHDEIGLAAGHDRADGQGERGAAARGRARPKRCAKTFGIGEARAPLLGETLTVFEQTQLFHGIEPGVGIGTDGKNAAGIHKWAGGKDAVAEISLGERAERDRHPAGSDCRKFGGLRVRRVDERPVCIQSHRCREEFDRRLSGGGAALGDLAPLFGNVDMDRDIDAQNPPRGGQRR
jgi:hypothetical protein